MRVWRFVGMACMVLCLSACSKKGPSTMAKLAGTWELTKSEAGDPLGSTIEFKDTAVTFTLKIGGIAAPAEGVYIVEGDTIKIRIKLPSGREYVDELKIKTLTDTTLETVDRNGRVSEYKKK